ncbi:CIC11C00000002017 [Sungouiella intermedia]|uniref:CIC11C00000002017 n=1 Tax=Sungouiella intermedia TaxID=45354 RepID=A0A1L0B8B3_9ASCO|nr:CIC11C00000002017 [[Candida] intermedia]
MGNVPTKDQRARLLSLNSIGSGSTVGRLTRRNTTLSLIGGSTSHLSNGLFAAAKANSKSEDKMKMREKHCLDLIVRIHENVDGGYLAPYGIYKLNLDYNTEIVRGLVLSRRLAPFYTPLQDFDESWTDDEIATLVRQMPLHALDSAFDDEEEEDDADDHKIHKSLNHFRRQELKRRHQELAAKMKEVQRQYENEYLQCKEASDPDVPSKDLLLRLYRDASECPICFLYFPRNLNYSRCCRQPICTECFVQIKRLDPHPPHDDPSEEKKDELPHTLISEYANCPYCAMSNFGVTYEHPIDLLVGMGASMSAKDYRERQSIDVIPEGEETGGEHAVISSDETSRPSSPTKATPFTPRKPRRRSSVAADAEGVITTDYIRPDWEQKLASAKSKLARKAATASAIHASNLILDEGSGSRESQQQYLMSLEDRMIEEAMRLLILSEEERSRQASKK